MKFYEDCRVKDQYSQEIKSQAARSYQQGKFKDIERETIERSNMVVFKQ